MYRPFHQVNYYQKTKGKNKTNAPACHFLFSLPRATSINLKIQKYYHFAFKYKKIIIQL